MSFTVVIGAGPGGLATAWELRARGLDAVVLEQDAVVGGIARTVEYRGYRFDIGGHRFFSKVARVRDLWREILGEDFLERLLAEPGKLTPFPGETPFAPAKEPALRARENLVHVLFNHNEFVTVR